MLVIIYQVGGGEKEPLQQAPTVGGAAVNPSQLGFGSRGWLVEMPPLRWILASWALVLKADWWKDRHCGGY